MIQVLGFATAAALLGVGRGEVIAALNRPRWPWGTLVVNTVGSLVAGIVLHHTPDSLHTVLGTAALGAFTTFSTFAVEVAAFWKDRKATAVAYLLGTTVLTVGAAVIGLGV